MAKDKAEAPLADAKNLDETAARTADLMGQLSQHIGRGNKVSAETLHRLWSAVHQLQDALKVGVVKVPDDE